MADKDESTMPIRSNKPDSSGNAHGLQPSPDRYQSKSGLERMKEKTRDSHGLCLLAGNFKQ